MDAPAVHTYLILNVGPPLGLIKYKKERTCLLRETRLRRGGSSTEGENTVCAEYMYMNIYMYSYI
jgi:hypothetical protein